LLLLLQAHRQVKLSLLASVFPQPIQYQSRKRNLQRFLVLPQLSVKLLWVPRRWGIEQLFKDCKTAGYHLEDTQVNDTRLLA
jgi:hypothetical protein